jgi:hypothetical protein
MADSENDCHPPPKRIQPPAWPINHPVAMEVAESPLITDVLVKRRSVGRRLVTAIALAIVIIAAGIAASLASSKFGSPMAALPIMLTVALVMPITFLLAGKRSERRIRRIVSQTHGGDLATLVRKAAEQPFLNPRRHPVAHALSRELARCGRLGETIRIQWKRPFDLVQPLDVTFEPRLLDEADPAFQELLTAVSSSPDPAGAASRASPNADDVLGVRRIRRNILLKGGWALFVVFALFLTQAAFDAYQRRAITPGLLFWGVMFVLALYGPARGGWFGTRQWLLAPASLVVRKAKPRDETSQLHLFERRKSVLCLQRQKKGPWLIAVADAEGSEQTIATNTEVSLLLRAWLSPLEPPPIERLSDLR